jgi:hypothetical protein
MISFTYNDMEFSAEEAQGRWVIAYKNADGKCGLVGAGLFGGVAAGEIEALARRLVQVIFPVGIRCVGPDVAHPIKVGDLKIVPPNVAHPNFIHWNKDSASFPKNR